jgi:pimeloyl-ACP methyl ester carboxylesterase
LETHLTASATVGSGVDNLPPYGKSTLAAGIRSRIVRTINGLAIHVLEAGFETSGRRCILLLHGFPELAYSWRKIMLPLAAAGYHVVAPDQRGYGRTTGWDGAYDGDLDSFRLPNLVRDALGLVSALGYRSVAAVVGHDFGSPVAAYCALIRPDVFRSVALMSAPFGGPPQLPFDIAEEPTPSVAPGLATIAEDLARLGPPRKHYQLYYQTREANDDMWRAPQGVHAFLRAYYHYKSADWPGNKPFQLSSFTASELAKMPTYYIMDLNKGMAETAAAHTPSEGQIAACKWLPDEHLSVYSDEFSRTGFQGALNWYRCLTRKYVGELETFSGRVIDVPAFFIAGKSDWGSISFRAPLRGWRRRPVLDGEARISSMARDIGFSRSSPRRSCACFCNFSGASVCLRRRVRFGLLSALLADERRLRNAWIAAKDSQCEGSKSGGLVSSSRGDDVSRRQCAKAERRRWHEGFDCDHMGLGCRPGIRSRPMDRRRPGSRLGEGFVLWSRGRASPESRPGSPV